MKSYREEVHRKREDWGIVLDVFDAEKSPVHKRLKGKVAQLIGDRFFTLLEGLVRENTYIKELERVYIGPGPRDKIAAILRKIKIEDLTSIARGSVEKAIEKAVKVNEDKWVKFFNESGPITKRLHSLELLPGIGKKKMWKIIQEREKKAFVSFKDISERIGIEPIRIITRRILSELSGEERYKIFVYYDPYKTHY